MSASQRTILRQKRESRHSELEFEFDELTNTLASEYVRSTDRGPPAEASSAFDSRPLSAVHVVS